MIALLTKTDSGWEHDKFLAQPTTGLLEQQLVTTYRDADGIICQTIVSRKFFNEKDYVDSTTNKILG